MRVVRISGPDDPRVAQYADIGDHERLCAGGVFVAEGRLVVERLIADELEKIGRFSLQSLLLNEAAFRALEPKARQLGDTVTVFVGAARDFETLTGYNFHRGCLGLASRSAALLLDDLLATARSLVVLEEIGNADNVGSIFRNAAAFGVDGIVLSHGCADPLYRKAIRTSMAATLRVPFSAAPPGEGWCDTLVRFRSAGFQIVALTPDESAQDLDGFVRGTLHQRIALLFGSEGAGLSSAAEEIADVRVRIGIRPDVDSLNVAVAAGIALHRFLAPAR